MARLELEITRTGIQFRSTAKTVTLKSRNLHTWKRQQATVSRDAFLQFMQAYGRTTGFPFVVAIEGDTLTLTGASPRSGGAA